MRSFDAATFVAFGAAQLGVAGNDVLMEFDYSEIYAPLDLDIGHCRIAVAATADWVARAATMRGRAISGSPPNIPRSPAAISQRAASRPNASSSTAQSSWRLASGLCRHIVDLVQTGATLKANGLVEVERIADVSSRLIVNRPALKTRPEEVGGWIERFRAAVEASC